MQKHLAESKTIVITKDSMRHITRESDEHLFCYNDYSSVEQVIISLLGTRELVMNSNEMSIEQLQNLTPNAYLFKPEVLEAAFETSMKNLYSLLNTATKNLMQSREVYGDDGESFLRENLFTRCVFNSDGLYMLPSQAFYEKIFLTKQGFAEIDQRALISVRSNSHAMRLFRILSRFKQPDHKLFPFNIEKLKVLFGVVDVEGNVIKKSYVSNSAFLSKIIGPAIKTLASSDVVSQRLRFTLHKGSDGREVQGYAKHYNRNKVDKLEFLYEWNDEKVLPDNEYNYTTQEAIVRLEQLVKIRNSRKLSLDEMYEMKACFLIHQNHGTHDMSAHIAKVEEEIENSLIEKEQMLEATKEEFNFGFLEEF